MIDTSTEEKIMAVVDFKFEVLVERKDDVHEYVRDQYFDITGRLVPVEDVYLSEDSIELLEPKDWDDWFLRFAGSATVHDPAADALTVSV